MKKMGLGNLFPNGVYTTKAWELKYHNMVGIPYTLSGFDQKSITAR